MNMVERFKDKYGEEVLNELLEICINDKPNGYDDCTDDLCDDEMCNILKSFKNFIKYHHKDINKKYKLKL